MDAAIKRRISQIEKGKVPEGYKNTPFGIFPRDWELTKKLGDLGEFAKGNGTLGSYMCSSGEPCIGYGDIYTKYDICFNKAQSFLETTHLLGSPKIGKGTLLFTATGETAEEIGKCVCYNGSEPIYVGGDIIIFTPQSIHPVFVSYQQHLCFSIKQKAALGQGHSVVHIHKSDLANLYCVFPKSEAEQQKIAEILQAQDRMIELKERLLALKQQQKKYLMQQLLTGKIRLPGFTGEWKKIELGEIFDYFQPTAYIVNSTNYVRSGVPVLTAGKTFILGYTDEMDGVFQDTPAVLFDDFTTSSQYVDFRFKVKSSAVKILKCKSYFNDIVAFYKLQSVKHVVGNHERHWISKFSSIPVLMPPIEEQTAIAEVLSTADAEIGLLKKDIEQEKLKKKSLMQLLLTGIVRV